MYICLSVFNYQCQNKQYYMHGIVWNIVWKIWHPCGFSATVCVNERVLTPCDSLLMCHVSGICFWNILLFDPAYLPTVNMWPGALVWLAGWLTCSQAVSGAGFMCQLVTWQCQHAVIYSSHFHYIMTMKSLVCQSAVNITLLHNISTQTFATF